MPELPEAETARRKAERALRGRRIVGMHVAQDDILFESVAPGRFKRALRRARVTGSGRKGKHFWLELDRRPWLLLHWGMSGRIEVYGNARERPTYCKLERTTEKGTRVTYTNKRRIGRLRLRHDPVGEDPVASLGFDALTELPRSPRLQQLFEARRSPMKALLLDQKFGAGIGNWVADKLLYQARLKPTRLACDLTATEVQRLRRVWKRVIEHAVNVGADAEQFPRTWLFHHRCGKNHGTRTADGHRLEFSTVGGRTTAWAPAVQH